jgi:hypothetical protein
LWKKEFACDELGYLAEGKLTNKVKEVEPYFNLYFIGK